MGQSTCVSIGGDPIVGSTFVDLLGLLALDAQTEAVVIYGEPGGTQEEALAQYVAEQRVRVPIVAFISGRFVDQMPGQRFGHAGVMVDAGRGSAASKMAALREAGIQVAVRLSDVPRLVRAALVP
jgi:succinyl-CoA synthetase alpha subunit